MTVYFISDLHLNLERPATMQMLHNFLRNFGTTASAIYILGDLFDYWAGDDLSCKQFSETIQLLNETSKYAKIYFMHGNRDFLVDTEFARQSNCTILPDPYLIHLDAHKVLLAHGDAFCTFDKKYQLFRTIIRAKLSKTIYLAMPTTFRERLVNDLRNFSKKQNKQKFKYAPQTFAVNPDTLAKYIKKYSADTIIYGHVHTRKMENLNYNNIAFKHIVLPDWQDIGTQVLCYADNNFSFREVR